ncbi:MAG: nucleoside deaminase [Bacteroidales bacterium]|nr:nucleoside deaminase [Bacteroidales bacterium]
MYQEKFMKKAVALSAYNIRHGGGPFGAVIVKDGVIIAMGRNRVTSNNDPTAHAEVMTIRSAARKLKTFNLEGCEIYTSCEPCPMCLSAIYWAHINKVYYANTKHDAAEINFDDSFIYDELALPMHKRKVVFEQHDLKEAKQVFDEWKNDDTKIVY